MPKRTIPHIEKLSADTQAFFDTLNGTSDLAMVVVTASYLDASLASLLQRYLAKGSAAGRLLDVRGPVGTMSARLDLAHALRLIDKPLFRALAKVIEIRNQFAHHHLEETFQSPHIAALCMQLTYLEDAGKGDAFDQYIRDHMSTPRSRFETHAIMLSQRLLMRALEIPTAPDGVTDSTHPV
jgi:DNA-binding MltR family transcriptional regulator